MAKKKVAPKQIKECPLCERENDILGKICECGYCFDCGCNPCECHDETDYGDDEYEVA